MTCQYYKNVRTSDCLRPMQDEGLCKKHLRRAVDNQFYLGRNNVAQ